MIRFLPLTLLALGACFGEEIREARDRDGDGFEAPEVGGTDCDDDNALVNPEAPEVCGDGVDNNCDGAADDAGFGNVTWYPDEDGDGFGADDPQQTCEAPADSVPNLVAGADCNDTNSAVNPSIVEQCGDGVDNDCNGVVDDSLDSVSYYVDNDLDGFPGGDRQNDCTAPQSSFPDLSVGEDCDDANVAVNPDAGEICGDGLDNDCDGATDDSGLGAVTWYVDSDNDGYPGPTAFSGCVAPNGSFATLSGGTDCNDLDASVSPAVAEIYYDGIDQNCDGANDYDADEDGEPSDAHGGADCDDTNASVRPTAIEVCNNGLDDDCSGDAPECAWEDGADIDDVAGTIWTSSDAIVDQLVTFQSGTDGIDDLAVFVRGPRLDWVNGPFSQGTRSLASVRSGRMTDSLSASLTKVHSAIAVETPNGLDGGIMFGVEGLNRVMHLTRPFPTFGVLGTSWSVVTGVENTNVGWALAGGTGLVSNGGFGWATATSFPGMVRDPVYGLYVWNGIPDDDDEGDADREVDLNGRVRAMQATDVNADSRDDLLVLESRRGGYRLSIGISPQSSVDTNSQPGIMLDEPYAQSQS